jgi:hypothetical protein
VQQHRWGARFVVGDPKNGAGWYGDRLQDAAQHVLARAAMSTTLKQQAANAHYSFGLMQQAASSGLIKETCDGRAT